MAGRIRGKGVRRFLRARLASDRFGATLFGSFGQVAPELSHVFGAELLPAIRAGLRHQLTRDYPMPIRLDYAWARDGGLHYFAVGEAF